MPYIADQVDRFAPGIVYTSTGSQFHATGEDAISTTIMPNGETVESVFDY